MFIPALPDLVQARDAADRHLTETLDATTRAAIFTTSGQGNLDFTDDRVKLHEALMKLMARPTRVSAGSECPDLSYYMADLIQNKNDVTALNAAAQEVLATCPPPQFVPHRDSAQHGSGCPSHPASPATTAAATPEASPGDCAG